MKRLVVCCDGTWQSLKQDTYPTSIFKIAQGVKPVTCHDGNEVEQVIYYDHGIGSGDLTGDSDFGEKITGGMFGKELDHKIQDPISSFVKIMF